MVKSIAQTAIEARDARKKKHDADQAAWLKEHFGFTQEEFEAQGFHIRHGGHFDWVGDFEIELPDGTWVDLGTTMAELGLLIQAYPKLVKEETS